MTHAGMKFSQAINPPSLTAFLLVRKVCCTVRRKADSLNPFDIPKFVKALGCGLRIPLALDGCERSAALNEGRNRGCILVTSSSPQANGRQNHCWFSNGTSCFGLTLCFISRGEILYFHPHKGKKNTDRVCKVHQTNKTPENFCIFTLQVSTSDLQKLV